MQTVARGVHFIFVVVLYYRVENRAIDEGAAREFQFALFERFSQKLSTEKEN